ncbi:MAG: PPOX class F420-dependent oxidoreductase [Chloroflexi bacterium]|nr:PPOX class F420-dependent oxidoreductase [Chloroflexota bacterium]
MIDPQMGVLNDKQREFLGAPRFGALATVNPDGTPHLTVMWYALDGDEIMFNTARERRKTYDLVRDGRVSLLVFEDYRFVRVSGVARETATGEAALAEIHRLAVRYDGEESARRAMDRFRTQERVSYRFAIRHVYASADLR